MDPFLFIPFLPILNMVIENDGKTWREMRKNEEGERGIKRERE